MNLIRVSETDDCIVDYDKERGKYRVSIFEHGHFWDEFWFDEYSGYNGALPIKRFEKAAGISEDAWWCGYCPICETLLHFNNANTNNDKKQYCWHCGQLVYFELK